MKDLIKVVTAIVLLSTLSCADKPQQQSADDRSPNVIFIMVDDMGYGDLSLFGQQAFKTPHIDNMASEGMVFTNFYTGATVCAPSRASLLTGKHTGHTSVRGNSPAQLIGDDELTIAKVMKQAGYRTAAIGKWGIGHPPPPDDPQRKGFDYFYGYINMWHAHNFYPEFLYENGEKIPLNNKLRRNEDGSNPWADRPEGTGVAKEKNEYVHDLFDQKALDFIDQNQDNKFFLYLAYNVPHANNEGGENGMEVPSFGEFADKDWPDTEKGFASMMRNIDNSVGMILSKLEDTGMGDNTMVIFCSDNGPHEEGGHVMEYFNSNGPYRGMKRDLYDGGVRTPFIVHWPAVVQPGTSTHLGAFWDVLPTFTDITGIEQPDDTDGISIMPTLAGHPEEQEKHDYLYWEFYELGGRQAILKGNWKAIRLNVRDQDKPVEFALYNLATDTAEVHNVADMHPEIVAEMEKLFEEARTEFAVVPLFEADGAEVETPF
jgi:arylsulfatase A-like enzyme